MAGLFHNPGSAKEVRTAILECLLRAGHGFAHHPAPAVLDGRQQFAGAYRDAAASEKPG